MESTTKDYGIGVCCPWPRNSFLYRGLYSHNALREGPQDDFDLPAEQLEAAATASEERRKENHRRQEKNRRNPPEAGEPRARQFKDEQAYLLILPLL